MFIRPYSITPGCVSRPPDGPRPVILTGRAFVILLPFFFPGPVRAGRRRDRQHRDRRAAARPHDCPRRGVSTLRGSIAPGARLARATPDGSAGGWAEPGHRAAHRAAGLPDHCLSAAHLPRAGSRGGSALRSAHAAADRDGRTAVLTSCIDLSDPDGPRDFFEAARSTFGEVDIVVANAGGPPNATAMEVGDDQQLWKKAFDTNYWSTLRLVHAALPGMLERQFGRVVIIGSTVVKEPMEGIVLSTVARTAVWAWAKTLSREVAHRGVTVNMAMPGLHATDRITERLDDSALAARIADIPAHRLGEPAEFATLVAYLCSRGAQFITGQAIAADGGALRSA